MRRVLVPLSLLCCLSSAAIELPRANEKWTTLKADEFEIISNASPSLTNDVAENLLRMRAAVGQVTSLNVRSPLPIKVFVFNGERSFAPYRDLAFQRKAGNITGVFVSRDTGNYILLQAGSQRGIDEVVYHELTHYFVSNTVSGLPVWVSEGLAEYYSTFETSGDEVHIGKPVVSHVQWLRGEKLIPLDELFAVDHDSPIYNESSRRGVFYAQSWALVHYLMNDDERRTQFGTFLRLIANRKSAQEAFAAAFGITYAKMESDLRSYVRSYMFPYTKYPIGQLTMPVIPKPEPLTYAEYVYELGDLVAHADPDSGATAEPFLAEALKADPANAEAWADVGWLHDLAGREQEALAAYQRAVQLGKDDPQLYVLYGFSILNRALKSGRDVPDEVLLEARRLFERGAQLDPRSARAWLGMGRTYFTADADPAAGIAALEKSLALAPGNPETAYYLLQLYAYSGRRADAARLFETILLPTGDRAVIAQAREALLMADLHDVRKSAEDGHLKEALAAARLLLDKATSPAFADHLRKMIADLERWDSAQDSAATLNAAVEKANAGHDAEALAIVDGLLPTITDPDLLDRAKEFRDKIAQRVKARKLK